MQVQRGSIVKCIADFTDEHEAHGYTYPKMGEYLVVRGLATHYPTGELLLTFEEYYGLLPFPLAAYCFKELQTPDEGDALIKRVMKLLTK
jgi:hypothetical protein